MIPIYIKKEARDKLWAYILAMPTCEVGGFGFATIEDDGKIVWYDTFVVQQTASSGGIDFEDAGIAYAIDKAAEDGFLADPNSIWVWWHSHHNMNTYWSTTDEEGVQALRDSGVPYMVSFVGNIKMENKVRIDVFETPLIGHATMEDCRLLRYQDEPFMHEIASDLAEFVNIKPPEPKKTKGNPTKGGTGKPGDSTNGSTTSSTKQLPPGTRTSDPGDKLAEALAAKAGYAEYTQDEREGNGGYTLDELGYDVDDEGDVFHWKDMAVYIGPAGDEASLEQKAYEDDGKVTRIYNGDVYMFEDVSYIIDNKTGEVVELVDADEQDERAPIVEAHAS